MKNLKDAIYTKYLGNADLVAALVNGLHFQTAPPQTDMPYGTYSIISGVPGRTFTEKMENLLVQFSIFSDTSDDAEVGDIFNKLKACFDNCASTLSVVGCYTIYVDRKFSRLLFDERNNSWQHVTSYQIELQRSKIVNVDNIYIATAADNTVHDITTEDISISVLAKADSKWAVGGYSDYIVSKYVGVGAGPGYYGWALHVYYTNEIGFFIRAGDFCSIKGDANVRDDLWHHYGFVLDRDNAAGCKYFVDGELNEAAVVKFNSLGSIANDATLLFGKRTGAGGYRFGGSFCDVKLYYAAGLHWSAEEIAYQAAHPWDYSAQAGSITEYWRCDEGSGLILNGNDGNDLTLDSVLAWDDYIPT